MAQSKMEGEANPNKVSLYNPNPEIITYAFSYDDTHWTKTSIDEKSKKYLTVKEGESCDIRVYTDNHYLLFSVERGKKYAFVKNEDGNWELEDVSG